MIIQTNKATSKEENQNNIKTDQSHEVENVEQNINEDENKIQPQPEGLSSDEKEEIKELTPEERISELEDKIARTFAEMENQRRRFEKEKDDAFDYGGFSLARETLNLVDNLERSKFALENDEIRAKNNLLIEIKSAIEEDRCEAIILGCAGMTDLTRWLSEETGIPVIDGVVSALKIVEALIGAGLKTSKVGGYSTPIPKDY